MQDDIVRRSYDRVADAYLAQRSQFSSISHLERLVALLPAEAKILDAGCGAGLPVDRFLLDRGFEVRGVDVSERQIELARTANPEATYEARDMQSLTHGHYAVDAIVSFYAIFHVPRQHHARIFDVLRSYLRPGGLLLVTMGSTDWEGVEDFHGAPMFWSHFDATANRALIAAAGFDVLTDEIDTAKGERHQVVLARARSTE